jgi:Ni,Fe-hydrogenase maturation factor
VAALAVHQLTPELAEEVGKAEKVVFVDAAVGGSAGDVTLQRLRPAADTPLGHVSSPPALLALAETLGGRCPEAWLLTIAGGDFSLGEGLSPAAALGLDRALQILSTLCCPVFAPKGPNNRALGTGKDMNPSSSP